MPGLDPGIHVFLSIESLKTWMAGTSPAMTGSELFLRRRRPRPLRTAQAFERLGHAEHAEVVEAAAHDLHADRETLLVVAAIDRGGRVLRHVPRHGVADVLKRFCRVVDRGGELGGGNHPPPP